MAGYQAIHVEEALAQLPGWAVELGRPAIARRFSFTDFNTAFVFMTRCAVKAEQIDHHPEWRNVYNIVDVVLTTHATGGLSDRDVAMAHFMDHVAGELGCPA